MTKKSRILGTAKVSKNKTIYIITEIRPFLNVKPGDTIVFIESKTGEIILKKETK